MTTNQPDRLDRIEATLERVAAQQEVNTAGIAELRNVIGTLVQVVSLHQQEIESIQRNFEAMQIDIRGLQLENRRMLEDLRGRNDEQ